jgi:hypothetical protein
MDISGRNSILTVGFLAIIVLFGTQAISAQNSASSVNQSMSMSPAAESQAGKLLYSDDFSSSKSGWTISISGDITAFYKNGRYHMTAVPANYFNGWYVPRLDLSDFIVQVEATKEAGPDDNEFGLSIRSPVPGSYYVFLISSDGYYTFGKDENSTWVTPFNWTKSSAIKTGNATNLLEVVARGDKFSFYANGEKLGDYTDSSFANGRLALHVGSTSEGNVTIGFDNFKVWAIKEGS